MPFDKAQALGAVDRALAYKPRASDEAGRNLERSTVFANCIRSLWPPNSAHRDQCERYLNDPSGGYNLCDHLFEGILHALRADIEADQLRTFEELVHADLFSDFLAQAEYLNGGGHTRAAAVLAGGALEEHLRQLAKLHSVPTHDSNQNPRKAAALNADLYSQASAYTKAEAAQVDAWQKCRNEAAHGDRDFEKNYTQADIRRMADGIRDFITKHPA